MLSGPTITQKSTTCVSGDRSPTPRGHFHVPAVNLNVHIGAKVEAACPEWKLTTTDRVGSASGDMVSSSSMLPFFRAGGLGLRN